VKYSDETTNIKIGGFGCALEAGNRALFDSISKLPFTNFVLCFLPPAEAMVTISNLAPDYSAPEIFTGKVAKIASSPVHLICC